ncbi:MAG: type II toxin-antitoxin system RelE/ParE family toxin [Gammaproteobacteria bacterium]|nr:type II toxin-antitoxin system RelE/ParE family toxin [Gammaproteobacteria bacterium]
MRIFKNKFFSQWARKIGLENKTLKLAVDEINSGLYEADLGGCLFKKRIGLRNKGKRSSLRTIVVFKKDRKAFYLYGFSKNKQANISTTDKKIYKELAALLLSYSDEEINFAVKNKKLIEVL